MTDEQHPDNPDPRDFRRGDWVLVPAGRLPNKVTYGQVEHVFDNGQVEVATPGVRVVTADYSPDDLTKLDGHPGSTILGVTVDPATGDYEVVNLLGAPSMLAAAGPGTDAEPDDVGHIVCCRNPDRALCGRDPLGPEPHPDVPDCAGCTTVDDATRGRCPTGGRCPLPHRIDQALARSLRRLGTPGYLIGLALVAIADRVRLVWTSWHTDTEAGSR